MFEKNKNVTEATLNLQFDIAINGSEQLSSVQARAYCAFTH